MLFVLLTLVAAAVSAADTDHLYMSEVIKGVNKYENNEHIIITIMFKMAVGQRSAKLIKGVEYRCVPLNGTDTELVKLDVELLSDEPPAFIIMDKSFQSAAIYRIHDNPLKTEADVRVVVTCAVPDPPACRFLQTAENDITKKLKVLGF